MAHRDNDGILLGRPTTVRQNVCQRRARRSLRALIARLDRLRIGCGRGLARIQRVLPEPASIGATRKWRAEPACEPFVGLVSSMIVCSSLKCGSCYQAP